MPALPSKTLETFPNPEPARDYIIEIEAPEFTCLCPKTGQPDFATLQIEYVPDRLCVELKALKLYIWSYRDEGHFHEKVTNTILNDLVAAIQPRYLQVRALFNVRGGLYTTVTAEYRQPGWSAPPPPPDGLPRVSQSARDAETFSAEGKPDRPREPPPDPASAPSSGLPGRSPAARAPKPERFRMPGRDPAAAPPDAKASSRPAAPASSRRDVYLGIDLGTGGCRTVAADRNGKVLALAEAPLPRPARDREQITQDPNDWWKAAVTALKQVLAQIDPGRVHRIAAAGTSGSLLLCDTEGEPVTPGILYNDRRAQAEAEGIAETAPAGAAVHGTGSSLAKLLWLRDNQNPRRAAHALHPADWIGNRLTGVYGHSDYHNCLKLGYDPAAPAWPGWFQTLDVPEALLPQVHVPGESLGPLSPRIATALGLPPDVEVAAGTTDGVAAFIAAGATRPGHGVTSLGNTLVIKLLSEAPIVSAAHGVYSHRLGKLWLAGGASNSGGNVLAQYFTPEQLREMTPLVDPESSTDLDYYPLTDIGERFPVNDPRMEPRLEPLPGDSVTFFQGILEGIARIEAQGYAALAELGAPAVTAVWTAGGGSLNPAWTRIRGRTLGVPLKAARSQQPAFGAALLAAGAVEKTFA